MLPPFVVRESSDADSLGGIVNKEQLLVVLVIVALVILAFIKGDTDGRNK